MKSLDELKKQLKELEESLLTPEVRTSKEKLSTILANDFFEIGSSGRVLYNAGGIPKEGLSVVQMQLSDFDIHPLSEEIVLTTYKIFNVATKEYSLRSSIWMHSEEGWRMKFHQGTKTKS